MKIRVYQINSDKDENRMMFMAYDRLELFQGSSEIDCKIYDKVYDKEVDCSNLEEVYTLLNIHRPADYEGRSLSVSDVVEVYESDAVPSGFYFCDSVGFKQVTFHPEECGISERINGQDAEKISVLFVEPGKYPRMIEIEDSLEAMQDTVKGDIEEFMDNVVDGLPGKLDIVRAELTDTQVQLENARTELAAPFAKEAELAEKTARLKELNILLNMDEKDKSLIDDVPDDDAPEHHRSRGMER